jgi:hypothetical protein
MEASSIHHTAQAFAGRIGVPGAQENTSPNSGRSWSGPITRYCGGECGSICAMSRAASSLSLAHQAWAWARKNCCSSVKFLR